MLLVEFTCLIGITTPMEETNDYNVMMDLKHDNGDPMFNSIAISLICEECRKQKKLECPHMEHEIPHWKRDKKRSRMVQKIMENDPALYLRENAGVVQKLDNHAFHVSSIDELLKTDFDYEKTAGGIKAIFVCVDTAGGGASCTAVCTGFYTPSHSLVVSPHICM